MADPALRRPCRRETRRSFENILERLARLGLRRAARPQREPDPERRHRAHERDAARHLGGEPDRVHAVPDARAVVGSGASRAAPDALGVSYDCVTPRRVLVRVAHRRLLGADPLPRAGIREDAEPRCGRASSPSARRRASSWPSRPSSTRGRHASRSRRAARRTRQQDPSKARLTNQPREPGALLNGMGNDNGGAAAIETAARLLANIETVVRGKTEEIKLVLTALVCGGHVLLEDVPGTAKTVLARAIAGSVEGATNQRIQCTPDLQPTRRHRPLGLRPEGARLRVPARARVRERRPRRRDQPGDAEDAVGAARGDGRAAGDDRRCHARAARALPRPRDREPDRAGGHLPAAGGPARPLLPPHRARLSERGRRARDRRGSSGTCIRWRRCGRRSGSTTSTRSAPRSRRSTSTTRSAAGRSSSCARRARSSGVAIGASVRGSLALERAISAWAILDGRDYVTPVDVERLFLPVLLHRIVFTPSFVATAREIGWDAASAGLREQCLALAPRPGAELEAVASLT